MVPWHITLRVCERSLGGQRRWNRRLWRGLARAAGAVVAGRPVARSHPLGVSPSADRRVLMRRSSQIRALARRAWWGCPCCEAMSRISSPLRAPRCTTAGRPPVANVQAAPPWLSRQAEYATTAPGYTGLQPGCMWLLLPPGCIGLHPSRRGGTQCKERTAAVRAAGCLARQVMAAKVAGAIGTDRQRPYVAAAARVEEAVEGLGGTPALNVRSSGLLPARSLPATA